jgi:hypothetical protein
MEIERSSKTKVSVYHITRRRIAKDSSLHSYRNKNFKYHNSKHSANAVPEFENKQFHAHSLFSLNLYKLCY